MFKKESIFKLLILLVLIILMFFLSNYLSGNEAFYKRALENRKEESYSGIVIEKYIDSAEHCTPMLKFTSNSSISLENSFWDEVKVGDSIVKTKGETTINLYKNNQLKQVFDYKIYFQNILARKSKQ